LYRYTNISEEHTASIFGALEVETACSSEALAFAHKSTRHYKAVINIDLRTSTLIFIRPIFT
jgi:hypothetical protein